MDVFMLLVGNHDVYTLYEHDQHGRTALHIARWHGHTQLVEILVNLLSCTEMLVKIVREIEQAKDEFCATVTIIILLCIIMTSLLNHTF